MKRSTWDALSKDRQRTLLNAWREPEYKWWDYVYEDFVEDCAALGVEVQDFIFSGFWSQGDGAAITAQVSDWTPILMYLSRPHWLRFAWGEDWRFRTYARSHNTLVADFRTYMEVSEPYDEEDDPLRYAAWKILFDPPNESDLDHLESDLLELFRWLADILYQRLEAEYEYLTNDETVIETILANEPDDEEDEEVPTPSVRSVLF